MSMNQVTTDTRAAQIQAHHDAAHAAADKAIEHAKQAGALLLEVKASLPHGDFTKWVEVHLTVSQRQAQRYMAAAEGKTLPVRAIAPPVKNDTVSYLPDPAPGTKEYAKALEKEHSLIAHLQYAVLMANVRLLPVEDRAAAYETVESLRELEFQVRETTRERDILMNENAEIKRALKRQRREIEALKKATH